MIDTTQFETFMSNYQDMVYGTAVRLLGNPTDAQDVAQSAFLKAFEHFHELAESPTAGGWLKTVTTNLCLNHLSRYRFRWRFFSEFASEEENPETLFEAATDESVTGHCEEADRRSAIEKALAKLPDSQRVPVVLYHFDNLSYQEIAERLGFSLSKVKTEIFRGRQALAKKLKLLAEDEPPSTPVWTRLARPSPREKQPRPGPLACCLT